MATQWQTFPIEFRGGLISNLSDLQQGANAVGSATILQNFEVNKEGGYTKIRGFTKYSTTEVPGTGPILALKVISSGRIIAARKVDAAAITAVTGLISGDENKTAYYYSTGTTWNFIAKSASTNGGKARHVLYNLDGDDKVIFVDSTNYPLIYNTSGNTGTFLTSADSTDVSGAEHVAIFKNAAFYAKGSDLFFSAPFSVDDFSASNNAGSFNVANDITGLAVFRDQLIIFTEDSVKRLVGSSASDFNVVPITDRIGCINGDTIQEVGGDIMYLAPDGIRLLGATDRIGDFSLDIPSDRIAKDANKFLSSTSNFTSFVIRKKNQYRIFAYVSSEQVGAAKGLIATKFISQGGEGLQWSTTKGIKANVADSRYSGTTETIAFANEDGFVYELDTGSDFDGENIEAIYESPYMPITDPQLRKTFYKFTLYAEPESTMSLNVNLKYDNKTSSDTSTIQPPTITIGSSGNAVFLFGDSSSVFNTATFGGDLETDYSKQVIGSGKTIAVRIADDSTNARFTLDAMLLDFRQNDRQ